MKLDKYIINMDRKFSDPDLFRAEAELQLLSTAETEPVILKYEQLLFELRVHQTELEMQNHELRRTQVALEESSARYLDLYDLAPVAYFTLSENALITEANLTMATLFGVERNKLINSRFARYVMPEDSDAWYRFFRQVKQGVAIKIPELTLHKADGTPFYAHLECLCVEKDNETMRLRLVIIDITERKLEEALRIAALAFDTHNGIIITDAHKVILCANQAFSYITGFNFEEIVGKYPSFLQSGLDDDFYKTIWTSLEQAGEWQGEIWGKGKAGQSLLLWLTINSVADTSGLITHYVGSFTDITELKLAEQALLDSAQRLEKKIISTQSELKKNTEESQELNITLNTLLRRQQSDRNELQSAFSNQIRGSISPFLEKLKNVSGDTNKTFLINILQNNIAELINSTGEVNTLASIYQLLTPVEIQVASMIRLGYPTKKIAQSLLISLGTVNIHRKHIRKKLRLNGKPINLFSYLLTLTE